MALAFASENGGVSEDYGSIIVNACNNKLYVIVRLAST